MFSFYISPKNSENATNVNTGHFGYDLFLTLAGKSHDYRNVIVLFSKCFPSSLKRKAGVFKFLRFEEQFSKMLRFRDGLVWTVGLTVEIKVRFQIFLAQCEHWGPDKYYFSFNVEGKHTGKDNLTINATHFSGGQIWNVLPIRSTVKLSTPLIGA